MVFIWPSTMPGRTAVKVVLLRALRQVPRALRVIGSNCLQR